MPCATAERRGSPRIPSCLLGVLRVDEEPSHSVIVVNLNFGGALIRTTRPLAEGTALLYFGIGEWRVASQVTVAHRSDDLYGCFFACRFSVLYPSMREELRALVAMLVERENGNGA